MTPRRCCSSGWATSTRCSARMPSVAAALLGLALTTRDKGKGRRPADGGFPHPALESYLAKLVQPGQRAAVCEQVEDPKFAKGLVKREVVRVVTPGHADRRGAARPEGGELPGRRRRGQAEARPGLGRAFHRAVLADGRPPRTELADEIARLNPAEALSRSSSLDAPWVRTLRASRPWRHDPAVVGLPGRAGPQVPLTTSSARPR